MQERLSSEIYTQLVHLPVELICLPDGGAGDKNWGPFQRQCSTSQAVFGTFRAPISRKHWPRARKPRMRTNEQ